MYQVEITQNLTLSKDELEEWLSEYVSSPDPETQEMVKKLLEGKRKTLRYGGKLCGFRIRTVEKG
jgi:hypothetical protein